MQDSPEYFPAHQAMAENLMPRWGAEPGELEQYAADVAKSIGGDRGAEVYARIVERIASYHPRVELFINTAFDYELASRGWHALLRRHPDSSFLLNVLAFYGSLMQDKETTRHCCTKLAAMGDPASMFFWNDREGLWTARSWAEAEPVDGEIREPVLGSHHRVNKVIPLAKGDTLVVLRAERGIGRVYLLDAKTGRPQRRLATTRATFKDAAVSADERLLCVVGGNRRQGLMVLWDLEVPEAPVSLGEENPPMNAVAFSPDSSMLAGGRRGWHDSVVRAFHTKSIDDQGSGRRFAA